MKKALRAVLNRIEYCWKCRSVYGENTNFELKGLNKQRKKTQKP